VLNLNYSDCSDIREVLDRLNAEYPSTSDNRRATVRYSKGDRLKEFIQYEGMRWLIM
jgi:hypothetical protein